MKTKLILTALFLSMICQGQLIKGIDYTADTLGTTTFYAPYSAQIIKYTFNCFANITGVYTETTRHISAYSNLIFTNGKISINDVSSKWNNLDVLGTGESYFFSITLIAVNNQTYSFSGKPILLDTMAIRERGFKAASDLCETDLKSETVSNISQQGRFVILTTPTDIQVYNLQGQLLQQASNTQIIEINNSGFYIIQSGSETKKIIIQ